MTSETVMCSFCDERPATGFDPEWDAMLCDECSGEQEQKIEEVREQYSKNPDPLSFFEEET